MLHSICENIKQIEQEIGNIQLVVVSKYRSLDELQEVYNCGHRSFGENRIQELVQKEKELPKDIKWHAIGHLQRNKVKYIAPFIHLIHSIDSLKLLQVVNNEAIKNNRVINFLFQIHIAEEDSKFGLTPIELDEIIHSDEFLAMKNVRCLGLMGMATFTDNTEQVKAEFSLLSNLFNQNKTAQQWSTLSMGMSGDYKLAQECGSTMIRVGSKIFQ